MWRCRGATGWGERKIWQNNYGQNNWGGRENFRPFDRLRDFVRMGGAVGVVVGYVFFLILTAKGLSEWYGT